MRKIILSSIFVLIVFSGCVETNIEIPKVEIIQKKEIIEKESPLLTKPKIAKVKIESYIDSDGDYHEAYEVHLKIKESEFVEDKKYFSINKD